VARVEPLLGIGVGVTAIRLTTFGASGWQLRVNGAFSKSQVHQPMPVRQIARADDVGRAGVPEPPLSIDAAGDAAGPLALGGGSRGTALAVGRVMTPRPANAISHGIASGALIPAATYVCMAAQLTYYSTDQRHATDRTGSAAISSHRARLLELFLGHFNYAMCDIAYGLTITLFSTLVTPGAAHAACSASSFSSQE